MMLIPLPDWPGAQHPGNQAHQNREHTTSADSCPSYRSTAQHTRHPRAVVVDLRMLVLHHCLEATLGLLPSTAIYLLPRIARSTSQGKVLAMLVSGL